MPGFWPAAAFRLTGKGPLSFAILVQTARFSLRRPRSSAAEHTLGTRRQPLQDSCKVTALLFANTGQERLRDWTALVAGEKLLAT